MSNNQHDIGKRLKEIRQYLGHSQESFSKLILDKPSKATISSYENGRMDIADSAKIKLYHDLGINKEWLENGRGTMFTTAPTPQQSTGGSKNAGWFSTIMEKGSQLLTRALEGKPMKEQQEVLDIFNEIIASAKEGSAQIERVRKELGYDNDKNTPKK